MLLGDLSEDLFAARLKDVMDGAPDPIYQDADVFFNNTYPTAGLSTLLREVLGRLTGQLPAGNPVIRYEQIQAQKPEQLKQAFGQLTEKGRPLVTAWRPA